MYRDRVIEDAIKEVANSFPSVVIYGSRQVGKSTTVNHIFGNKIRKVTLDDGDLRALAKNSAKFH